MAKEKSGTEKFIIVFVGVLLAVVLLGALVNIVASPVTLSTSGTESFNLSSLSCYASGQVNTSLSACNLTVANVPVDAGATGISSVVVTNNTGTELTVNTDYRVFAQTGVIQMLDTTSTNSTNLGNVAKVTYKYAPQGYLQAQWARDILVLVLGLLALGILVYVIAMALEKFKESE